MKLKILKILDKVKMMNILFNKKYQFVLITNLKNDPS